VRADRLLSIVLLLQARGCLTAPQLAAELEVSVRTVYRDMTAIGTAGIPVHAGPDGYRLVNGYRTRLTGLTAEEARGLVLAGLPSAAAELGLAEAVTAARLKLDAALPDPLRAAAARMRQRLHFDAPTWYDDGDSSDYLTAVADAVWRQRVIDIRYDSWKRRGDHRLQPYGLVLKTGRWYLVAGTPRGVRTYRVSQIQALVPHAETFEWPPGFDLAGYWHAHVEEFRTGLYTADAVIRVAPAAVPGAAQSLGRPAADAIAAGATDPDGWVRATVPIESESHACQQFLRLGADLEVVEPPSLRARLADTAARLAAIYQVSPGPGTGTRSAPVPTRDSAMVTGQAEARTRSGWCS
jgi:predicted DNA-binding transcriptional regulator YafY